MQNCELMKYLNSDLFIERRRGYSLINKLINSGNSIDKITENKLFEIFRREQNTEDQTSVINLLLRGHCFSIRNDVLEYWLNKSKPTPDELSGQIANYFSSAIECLETLLDILENKSIEDFPSDKIISDIFVAIRAQVINNNAIGQVHFNRIKTLIETKWHQKSAEIPIIEEIYKEITGKSYRTEKMSVQSTAKLENTGQKKYDIVLSFAGEDREHAEKLANLLKADYFSVFYDKYEEHNLWGKNLYEHLSEVYSKRGKYCVMFLSKHYAAKQWPTLERQAAQQRAFKENREYILPIRIDNTEIPGIPDTVAYQDLREKSIEAIYSILKRKLLPSEEFANTEQKSNSIKSFGLSDNTIKLLKILSDKSKHALANDPLLTEQEVLDAIKLSEEVVCIAADELEERGFVKLHKTIGMGKVGFKHIGATENLFASTDSYLQNWEPEKDCIDLAQILLRISKEGYGVSIQAADESLKWGPRRLNPALFLLIERDVVQPSKVIHSTYITIHVILKPKIHRYITNFKN